MSIASIMVYVNAGERTENHVRVARSVADKFGASIIGVSAFAVEPPFISEGVVIKETTKEDVERMKEALAVKGVWFQKLVGMAKEKVEWRWDVEYPTAFLTNEARSADLVVLSRKQVKLDYYNVLDPAEAMLRMGRPTLSVPEPVTELAADRIIVGWQDTREARLAVRDALPFITKASQVTIVEICKSDQQDAARRRVRDVAKYLQMRGAKCQPEVRVHMHESDARHLVRLAKDEGADLIVTGGYGHSRLGEWIFGGMTRGLLEDAQICLMMSH